MPPLIFMNAAMPGDRYRFTLAHELAHLVLHNQPETDEAMEEQADEFASEFLLPAKEIRPYLARPSLGGLARVKPYWKVSIKALLQVSKVIAVAAGEEGGDLSEEVDVLLEALGEGGGGEGVKQEKV